MRHPGFLPVALAVLEEAAPDGPEWVHEEKLDGYRIEAIVHEGDVQLWSRNRKEWTDRFPGVVDALAMLPVQSAVLDGEIVAGRGGAASAFQRLQQAMEEGRMAGVHYHVFDLLWLDGEDLRGRPLDARVRALRELLAGLERGSVVRPTRRYDPRRGDPLAQACARGLEGVVSKRADAPYPAGRGGTWVKSKCSRRQEFVIVGYTEPQGARTDFGALLLGVYDDGTLRYTGKVGTGFDRETLGAVLARLRPLETRVPAAHVEGPLPRGVVHWVRPALVAEIAFTEWTEDGRLRHPVFKGLRADKPARDVRRED